MVLLNKVNMPTIDFAATTAGNDYEMTSMNYTFTTSDAVGTQMCLTVNITEDNLIEGSEDFFVALTVAATGTEIDQTTVTIGDNEGTN